MDNLPENENVNFQKKFHEKQLVRLTSKVFSAQDPGPCLVEVEGSYCCLISESSGLL